MNILIASDSFKDALPALEVCRALEAGIRTALPNAQTRICPLADGGEGTFEALANALGMQTVEIPAHDPLLRPISAAYGRSADGQTAFIELAKTAGIQLLLPEERNPLLTSTFGVGQQIRHALEHGARQIILAIGSSATNDAGIGMAAALGWRFLDDTGAELSPIGQNLDRIASVVPPEIRPDIKVQVICDVNNPLFGPSGAAYVYARQKGADETAIEYLDHGLQHFSAIVAKTAGGPAPQTPGAGAAGGMGFGSLFFLDATLKRGADLVFDLLNLEEKLHWANLVVTGEGMIDNQTAHGKLIQRLCQHAARQNTPVIAFCGRLNATGEQVRAIGLQAAYDINAQQPEAPLAQMLAQTAVNLERSAGHVFSQMA
ncbi:MAG: glycerate kinase [Saprospiraceae bacterium]|nr:glycerate kinase [Saprospiraceae bacterium]